MQSIFSSLFVTIAMPSLATWTSEYATPAFWHTGASSSSLIGREALEMSVSPAQNFSKPPPVPDSPIEMSTPEFSPLNCSAAACAKGKTVDEPSILMLPDRLLSPDPSLLDESSPQAATPNARTPDRATIA